MTKIFADNSQTIGNTPLVRLNRVSKGNVLAKIEARNPSFSVKCRIGANMIWDAEKSGKLKPSVELVEPTSGNTGIAFVFRLLFIVCFLLHVILVFLLYFVPVFAFFPTKAIFNSIILSIIFFKSLPFDPFF